MKNLYFLRSMFLSALAAMAITACSDSDEGGNDGEGPGGGETPAPTSSLTVNGSAEDLNLTFDLMSASQKLEIDATGDWTFTCDDETEPKWCTPDMTEGKNGKSTLMLTLKATNMPETANYTLALKDNTEKNIKVTVAREPKGPWIAVDPETLVFPKEGGTQKARVYYRNVPEGKEARILVWTLPHQWAKNIKLVDMTLIGPVGDTPRTPITNGHEIEIRVGAYNESDEFHEQEWALGFGTDSEVQLGEFADEPTVILKAVQENK